MIPKVCGQPAARALSHDDSVKLNPAPHVYSVSYEFRTDKDLVCVNGRDVMEV